MHQIAKGYRTQLTAGFGLPLALLLSVTACDGPPQSDKPTRVVCHSGGIVIYDDFGSDPGLANGGIKFKSRTVGRYVRATGDCVAFNDAVPDGWKPILPGRTR